MKCRLWTVFYLHVLAVASGTSVENLTSDGRVVAVDFVPVDLRFASPRSSQNAKEGCTKNAECVPLPLNATCFGTPLPYTLTSYDSFTSSIYHYWDVQGKLETWTALQFVPKCWSVIQPLLCSIYLPECGERGVQMIQSQLCEVARSQCRIVDLVSKLPQVSSDLQWPKFLNCSNRDVFTSKDPKLCLVDERNRRKHLRFNTSSATCLKPHLISTQNPKSFYEPIDECGLNCETPFFSEDERKSVSSFVFVGVLVCFFSSLFAVLTFIVGGNWPPSSAPQNLANRGGNVNNYSNRVIFYMNGCFVIIMLGVMAQFFSSDAKSSITCRSDGTRRTAEPGLGENFYCVLVFILIYYFAIACCVWSSILVYSWSVIFRCLGKVKADHENNPFEKRGPYFHILAWSVPLVMTISIIFMNAIDADNLSGVCFVAHNVRGTNFAAWFVLVPLALTLAANVFFSTTIFVTLFRVSKTANDVISEAAGARIKATLTKIMFMFVLPTSLLILSTIVHQLHLFSNAEDWDQSLMRFLVCEAKRVTSLRTQYSSMASFSNECELKNKPSLLRIQMQLLCLFASSVLVSSLVWTRATCRTWKRFLLRILLKYCSLSTTDRRGDRSGFSGKRQDIKIRKHELVAQAYAKRHQLKEKGRLSLTFHSSQEDPVGIRLDSRQENGNGAGNVNSENFSSTWAAALPRLVQRRNGLVGAVELGLKRSTSVDSELNFSRSVSIRSKRFSYDSSASRRHSFADSQFSVHQSELDHLQTLYKSSLRKSRRASFFRPIHRRGRMLSRKLRTSANESSCNVSRNGSVTSQDAGSVASSINVLPAVTLDPARLEASYAETDEKAISKLKTKLTENLFQVPPPGRSTDFTQRGIRRNFNATEFIELQERLRSLTGASKTSHETFLSDEELQKEKTSSVCVQTSLTDLSGLGKRVASKDASTQDDLGLGIYHASSTNSSSQTESHHLLGKLNLMEGRKPDFPPHPVDAHAVKMRVPGSEDSSSIPSSYEAAKDPPSQIEGLPQSLVQNQELFSTHIVAPPLTKESFKLQTIPAQHHKRGRRGGIVETDENRPSHDSKLHVLRTGHTLDEIEIKVKHHPSSRTSEKLSQLQNLPDAVTVVSIPTPSS